MLKEKLMDENPLDDVEPPRKPHKLPKSVTEDELQAVCIAVIMDYQEKHETGYIQDGDLIWRVPLMLFAFCTGMRASELARLRWGHLDFDKRLITIRKQKNHKEQTIPLNARAVAVLDMVGRGEAEDYVFAPPAAGTRAYRSTVRRAGVEGVHGGAEARRDQAAHHLPRATTRLLHEARRGGEAAVRHQRGGATRRREHVPDLRPHGERALEVGA